MKRITALLVAALVPLGLIACGGDEDKGPSKDDYITKADAICTKSDAETNQIFNDAFEDPQKPKPDEAQAALKQSLPIVKQYNQQLEDLERPKDDEDELETLYASLDTGVKSLEEASADPDASLAALLAEPFAQANKLAKDYGFKECGKDE